MEEGLTHFSVIECGGPDRGALRLKWTVPCCHDPYLKITFRELNSRQVYYMYTSANQRQITLQGLQPQTIYHIEFKLVRHTTNGRAVFCETNGENISYYYLRFPYTHDAVIGIQERTNDSPPASLRSDANNTAGTDSDSRTHYTLSPVTSSSISGSSQGSFEDDNAKRVTTTDAGANRSPPKNDNANQAAEAGNVIVGQGESSGAPPKVHQPNGRNIQKGPDEKTPLIDRS